VLYCVAFITHTHFGICATIKEALNDVLSSLDHVLMGYTRQITNRIRQSPTKFDPDHYLDLLSGYWIVENKTIKEIKPVTNAAELTIFLNTNDVGRKAFIKHAESIGYHEVGTITSQSSDILSPSDDLLIHLLGAVCAHHKPSRQFTPQSTLHFEGISFYYQYVKKRDNTSLLSAAKTLFKRIKAKSGGFGDSGVDRAQILSIDLLNQTIITDAFEYLITSTESDLSELKQVLQCPRHC